MKEYQYIAYVCIVGIALPLRFMSGWWTEQSKAKAEVEAIMANGVPCGLYNVSMNLKERTIQ